MDSNAYDLRRAALPEILLSEDVAAALALRTRSAAARLISSGRLGPPIRIGRRVAVEREDFLDALRARADRHPTPRLVPGAGR